MNIIVCYERRKISQDVPQIIPLLLVLFSILRAENTLGCPSDLVSSKCSCYDFEDGVFVDCQEATAKDIKNTLKNVTNINSLSVIDLDEDDEYLGPNFIPPGVCVKRVHISQTNLRDLADDSFEHLRKCLETLSIVSGKIQFIPQKTFSGLLKLISIDLTSNLIESVPGYSFYGLPLMKLNMKGNVIYDISESAFTSLELSLSEIDLSENNLSIFPISAISKLRHLRSLRLAWNSMSTFPIVQQSDLVSLEYLNLNSNNFEFISEDCLKFCPSLKVLSFHFNFINNIHYRAFHSLFHLETLDVSHNRIKILNPNLFHNNKKLVFVDLSHNHLHHINGLFCNLPSLAEVVLTNNNILDVPKDSFFNSTKIDTIYLDKNSIFNVHTESFSNLGMLTNLHLDFNYLNKVPHNIFINNKKLIKLRLDNNILFDLENNTFSFLVKLSEIRLNNNNLKFISKHVFSNSSIVEEIYLHDNKIDFIEPGAFMLLSNLKYLSLSNNHLTDLNDVLPKINSKLHTLYLDSNSLTGISNIMIPLQINLDFLSITSNNIKYIAKNAFGDVSSITRLELNNNAITIIEEYSFQHFNLTRYLDLRDNFICNITNYTFYGLTELEDLNISNNKIVFILDMAFHTLRKLRNLNLSFNPLKALHRNIFQQGLPLSSLYMDNCEIQFIEEDTFNGLNNLKILSLKNNSLKSTDLLLIDVPGLKHLYFSYNILDQLPVDSFVRLPLLETLYLEHCNIETIFTGTFRFNRNIVKLNLAQNIISSIPDILFSSSSHISELNFSNNFLDVVPYNTLHNFTYLETLDIADNLLPRLELSGFEKLIKLKTLILKKNELKVITAQKKIKLLQLISLDLSNNRLENLSSVVFETFPNLQNLNITYNNIIHFYFNISYTGFGATLINIDISRNPTISWTTSNKLVNNSLMANLYELRLSATNMSSIEDIKFDSFLSLQHLYLQLNKLRRLSISPFAKLTLLEDLDLSYNKISQLKTSNFRGLTKLTSLCLSNNNIESIETFTEDLANLKLLDLSHNKLQNILNEDLIHLKELTVFYLGYNNIKYISATAFRNLNKITLIDLDRNKLHNLSLELLTSIESHIQEITLKDNIMICNCEKDNTWVWIQDHPKIIKPTAVSCLNNEYPTEKCDIPIISQLSIDKHKDNSVSVSWFIRNRTAIKSLQLLYYAEDIDSEVKRENLERDEVSARLNDLEPNANYVVCVITLDEDPLDLEDFTQIIETNNTYLKYNGTEETRKNQEVAASILMHSPSSECITFNTNKKFSPGKIKPDKVFDITLILDRRMGLIVGCSLGCVVFFIMVSILLYTKIKERKRIAKSDPAWAELNDYRSMSKEDILHNSTTVSTDNILLGS
ncbi:chaoptin [Plutella xylostella]|uniref:chaoptin n=1 Tax=Plutella xylostella TaxID=51655 RepID=UPI0020329B58|nr:chaoptin [Plutella xylostella]